MRLTELIMPQQGERVFTPHIPTVCYVLGNNVAQSINNTTETTVNFTVVAQDVYSMFSSPTKIVIPKAGIYLLHFEIGIEAAVASYDVYFFIRLNGTTDIGRASFRTPPTGVNSVSFSALTTIKRLAANDFIEGRVWQNSGGAINIGKTSGGNALPTQMEVAERLL